MSSYRNCPWPKKIVLPKFMFPPRDSIYSMTGQCTGLFASIWEISERSFQLQHSQWDYLMATTLQLSFFSCCIMLLLIPHSCPSWGLLNIPFASQSPISSVFSQYSKLVSESYWAEAKMEFSFLDTSESRWILSFRCLLVTLSSSN